MRTVNIFKNRVNQAIRLPKDMSYKGVSKLEIIRNGDTTILRPIKPNWLSFIDLPKADNDFLQERTDIIDFDGMDIKS